MWQQSNSHRTALAIAFALPIAVLAQNLASVNWPDLDTPVDEEELLQLETNSPEFAGDDTSLLQVRVQLPATAAAAGRSQDPAWPPSLPDVPEAWRAWALFQAVPASLTSPFELVSSTDLEPPGGTYPNQSQLLKDWIRGGAKTYKPPVHPGPNTEPWVFKCMGADYDINNFSSWAATAVATPQLVPFVVPPGTKDRSDVSVVIAPGGGGSILAWEAEGTDVAKWLNRLGISAFVLKYRIPDTLWDRSAEVMDAQRALSLVRRVAPALQLNASRVGLFGSSHGGWVSLFTAFAAGRQYPARDSVDEYSPLPDFLLLLYPEVTLPALRQRAESSDPVGIVGGIALTNLSNAPPIFIATGASDTCCTVNTTYALHNALKLHGNPLVEINVYEGVGHGFSMCYRFLKGGWEAMKHEACLWMLRARRFIMWNIEGRVPDDVRSWYEEVVKFDSLVGVKNSTGLAP